MRRYELWDTETGNLVDAFDREGDALVAAAELIAANTPVYPAAFTLLRAGDHGSLATVAEREPLAAVAERAVADRAKRTAWGSIPSAVPIELRRGREPPLPAGLHRSR